MKPNTNADSRFLSWLNLVRISDRKNKTERLAIVQRLTASEHTETQKWRILYLQKDGQINEEIFSYPERGEHWLGLKLVMFSSESSSWMGYKSGILFLYPSLIFPLLYPICTSTVGFFMFIIGIVQYLRGKLLQKTLTSEME